MKVTKVQRFMLYSLGKWFEEANKIIKGKPLEVSISKKLFIDVVKNAEFAKKQSRALYRNLETLEKKKLIKYANKELELTPKGKKLFQEIKKDVEPYVAVNNKLLRKSPISYTKKVQTIFK